MSGIEAASGLHHDYRSMKTSSTMQQYFYKFEQYETDSTEWQEKLHKTELRLRDNAEDLAETKNNIHKNG